MNPSFGFLEFVIQLAYLLAAILFILGLRALSSARTARNGNLMASVGMLLAVVATLMDHQVVSYGVILAGMAVGGAIGLWSARTVQMTDMPQMVALFNGSGGGAAMLVSMAEYMRGVKEGSLTREGAFTILLGALIGGMSLTGSVLAFGKLQGLVSEKPLTFPMQRVLNLVFFAATLALGAYLMITPGIPGLWAFIAASLLLGLALVAPIGGGDMPVVISLLNSFTGLATAATGIVLNNTVLVISGTLVGASGTLLTLLMCKAMNRSIGSVVFGAFGAEVATASGGNGNAAGARSAREVSVEDAAVMLAYAKSVVVVPGYGLAVAQAQHSVRELAELLEKKGVQVKYAIHPVAGRMPGHMNVLLAEANVPYPQLIDMEEINPQFSQIDVALVIGANDVVNPAARTDKASPIYGMPILDVDHAHHTIVLKRSMKPGFAGIDNDLFYEKKTMMLFGDAKDSINNLVGAVKGL